MSRLIALVVLVLLAPCPAYAYLDPGTGSILVQTLLAGLAVASAAVAAFWGRIRRLFQHDQRPADPGLEQRPDPDGQGRSGS
jgi:hypothetical protein